MELREAIPTAIARALEVRGSYEVTGKGPERWTSVTAAVDGSMEIVVPLRAPKRPFLRGGEPLAAEPLRSLGFEVFEFGWLKPLRAYPGATKEAAAAIERVFVEMLSSSRGDKATVDLDYPGLVPGCPGPPPDAPHAEHIRDALAVFSLDPETDLCVRAGLPSCLYLQLALAPDGQVHVDATIEEDRRPEIPGFAPSPEVELGVRATYPLAEVADAAAAVMHEHLRVSPAEPLFIELSSDVLILGA